MKKRIQLFSCFLAVIFLLGATGAFADNQVMDSPAGISAARMAVETASNLAYNRILEYYGEEAYMLPNEVPGAAPAQQSAAPDYGDVYAGAYLNDDGKLVVLLAGGTSSGGNLSTASATQSNILSAEMQSGSTALNALPATLKTESATLSAVAQRNDLIFQQAKYSYSYLYSLNALLLDSRDDHADDQDSIWQDIVGFGIQDNTNSLWVHIVDVNEGKIERFKQEIIDSDAIIFGDADGSFGLDADLYLGNGVCNADQQAGSIGYRATRYLSGGGTQTGFVTAAHVMNSGLVRYRLSPGINSWASVGYVRVAQNEGSVDAAFVEITESSLNLTNRVFNSTGTSISSGYITPAVGSTVCMAGDASRSYNYGSVISTSYSGKSGYSDLVLTTYSREEGDSGGIVFASSGGVSRAVGIHQGWATVDGTTRALYCKAANIAAKLNVFPA